jgi:hypothetical protein
MGGPRAEDVGVGPGRVQAGAAWPIPGAFSARRCQKPVARSQREWGRAIGPDRTVVCCSVWGFHAMRVAAPGLSTPGTSSPKAVQGARPNGLTPWGRSPPMPELLN